MSRASGVLEVAPFRSSNALVREDADAQIECAYSRQHATLESFLFTHSFILPPRTTTHREMQVITVVRILVSNDCVRLESELIAM